VLIGNPGGDIIGVPVGVVDDSCDWGELPVLSAQRPILTWHAVPRKELFTQARKSWVKEITVKAKSKL